MAGTMNTDGMDEISRMLAELGEKAAGIAAKGLYDGAGVMSRAINQEAARVKTEPFKFTKDGMRQPSPEEKAVILEGGARIAKFDKNGAEVNTSVGYGKTGYAEMAGKTVPIPLIVNSINHGTSFMKKQPFIRKAAVSGGRKAEEAMKERIEYEISKLTGK